jgi:hypothetical protein
MIAHRDVAEDLARRVARLIEAREHAHAGLPRTAFEALPLVFVREVRGEVRHGRVRAVLDHDATRLDLRADGMNDLFVAADGTLRHGTCSP